MTVSRMIARPLIAAGFVAGAANALRNVSQTAPKAASVTDKLVPLIKKAVPTLPIPDDPATLLRINAGVQIVAALSLATGRAPRLSSAVLAASLAPTTVAGHAFWSESDKEARQQQLLQFCKNLSVLGGVIIAAGDTEGQPGVAWRARRAAKDAKREAKRLAVTTRREAKLRKAQLT